MESERIRERALHLLSVFSEAHGVSGFEGRVRGIFREEIGTDAHVDGMGNILCPKRGTSDAPVVMLAAHMDEVGFMVQSVARSGLIKFLPLGGWWAHAILGQRVRILTRENGEIPGVIGAKPPHFLGENERDKVMKFEDLFIDIGAASAEEVRDRFGVRLGDSIAPESGFAPLGNPEFLVGKAFDDRAGLALMTQVLGELENTSHPNTVYGVGTVQEEVGTRGAQTAPHSVNPDVAIVLEAAPADDLPSVPEDERQGALGSGPQIRIMDPSAMMNRNLVRYARELAEARNIPHQMAVRRSGGTDARPIHLHARGVPTMVLGIPARYIHTYNSILCIRDYLSAFDLVMKLVESLDSDTVERLSAFD